MKKMMMIAAMMVATLSANAQNEVGQISIKPTVGLNIASMSKFDYKKLVLRVSMVFLRILALPLLCSTLCRV